MIEICRYINSVTFFRMLQLPLPHPEHTFIFVQILLSSSPLFHLVLFRLYIFQFLFQHTVFVQFVYGVSIYDQLSTHFYTLLHMFKNASGLFCVPYSHSLIPASQISSYYKICPFFIISIQITYIFTTII